MAKKLSGTALSYISDHVIEVRKHKSNRYRVLIVADSAEAANNIGRWLKTAWNAVAIKDQNDNVPNDISIQFDYMWQRDQAVDEINKEINDYRRANPDSIVPPPTPTTSESEDPTTTDEPEKEKTNWTTYIIIGLAAVAIILLVWPKPKK